jgi:uncharacterized protein (TIGR03083 family)
MSFDFAATYRDIRVGLLALAPELTADEWATLAPATPEWTVKDLYAHLAGIAADVLVGNVVFPGTDEWTAKQVGDRSADSADQVCAEWAKTGPELEARIDELGPALSATVIDVWHHDQDARNAIDHHANRTGEGLHLALRSGNAIGPKLKAAGLPTLAVSTEAYERLFGEGEAEATVTADPYELARAFMGRRSFDQIRSFDWSGDPEPYLASFSVFPPRPDPLVE